MRTFRRLRQGIRNLIRWIPIVWSDGQWDQYYFYKLLYHKLAFMHTHFKYHTCCVFSEKEVKQILIARELCKRIMDEDYEYYGKKIGLQTQQYDYEAYMLQQDIAMLGQILLKSSLKWWD